jgi:hypothetical protein
MAAADSIPTRAEVRRTLVAAADVIFSDGAPEEFLDQWADATLLALSLTASPEAAPAAT